MTPPRFLVPENGVRDGHAEISGPELRHLDLVLRLKKGARVELIEPGGQIHSGEIVSVGRNRARIKIIASRSESNKNSGIILAAGILKGPRMDLIVEKAVEFGIGTIIPLLSAHTNPAHYKPSRRERWQRLIAAACKQCGRTLPPTITEPREIETIVADPRQYPVKIMFYEGDDTVKASRLKGLDWDKEGDKLALIGPEGGFSKEEAELARQNGFTLAGLGSLTLRAETAAMAAMTIMRIFSDQDKEL